MIHKLVALTLLFIVAVLCLSVISLSSNIDYTLIHDRDVSKPRSTSDFTVSSDSGNNRGIVESDSGAASPDDSSSGDSSDGDNNSHDRPDSRDSGSDHGPSKNHPRYRPPPEVIHTELAYKET